MFIILIGIIQS